jgi:transcriptional repressor NrdR
MTCPKCENETRVLERRQVTRNLYLRRRECRKCGYRFNTYEKKAQEILPVVVETR